MTLFKRLATGLRRLFGLTVTVMAAIGSLSLFATVIAAERNAAEQSFHGRQRDVW